MNCKLYTWGILLIGFSSIKVIIGINLDGGLDPSDPNIYFDTIDGYEVDTNADGKVDSLSVEFQVYSNGDYSVSVSFSLWDLGDTFMKEYSLREDLSIGVSTTYTILFDPVPFEDQWYVDIQLNYESTQFDFVQLAFYYLYPIQTQSSIIPVTDINPSTYTTVFKPSIVPFNGLSLIFGLMFLSFYAKKRLI